MSMALVMAQMPDVWRKVLAEHLADDRGRCRACVNANGETASWPCQTYRVAQEAKWVSEGNLPGTGPHGPGATASPRLSRPDDLPSTGGHRGPDTGGYGPSQPMGSWAPSPGRPATGGWDLPATNGHGTRGYDLPATNVHGTDGYGLPATGGGYGTDGYDLPATGGHGTGGYDRPASPAYGSYDLPATGGYGADPLGAAGGRGYDNRPATGGYGPPDPMGSYSPMYDDAAAAFGGTGSSAPALASLPPLPASAAPTRTPEPIGWARDPFADDEPRRRPWSSDSDGSAPYGSTVDAPYGSSFGVDDRPRSSWS